jgi:small subunit ribosomal protein S16
MGSATGSPPGVLAARQRNFWEKTVPVAVKIKLKRLGKIRAPYYRIVVADARTKRDGRAIEEIGKYHPKAEPSFIEVNSERAQHWLSVGAQPTDPVRKILEITGDWQRFKGLPGAEGTLKTAAPKEDRKEIFAAAVKENMGDGAAAPKSKGRAAAGRDSEPAADKGGKAAKDTASAKGERPARAKADDQPAKAKSGGADDAKAKDIARAAKAESGGADDAKAKDTAGDAKAKAGAKDGAAKDRAVKDSAAAKGSTAKAGSAKGGKAGGARDTAGSDAPAEAAATEEPATGVAADAAQEPPAEATADATEEPAAEEQSAAATVGAEPASGD